MIVHWFLEFVFFTMKINGNYKCEVATNYTIKIFKATVNEQE